MWNGLPCVDFQIKVGFPLNNGLGSITVGDDTLLDCGQFKDSGGVLGTPSTAVARVMANDSIYRNHLLRKKKLFHCLLKVLVESRNEDESNTSALLYNLALLSSTICVETKKRAPLNLSIAGECEEESESTGSRKAKAMSAKLLRPPQSEAQMTRLFNMWICVHVDLRVSRPAWPNAL